MTRRSLAVRRGDGSSALRPNVAGYINFTGTVDGYVGITRPVLTSVTTVEFAIRVQLGSTTVNNFLVGWSWVTQGTRMRSNNTGTFTIAIGNDANNVIGNAASTGTIPATAATQPTWLRARCTRSTAQCEYWYSNDNTDVYSQVTTWTAVGTPTTGINAGTTPLLSLSNKLYVGGFAGGNSAMTGRVYAFYEFINGINTAWFINTDVPDPPATSYTSAGGGQVWSLSPVLFPSSFIPSQSFQGGLRNDFAFDIVSTGLAPDVLLGVVDVGYTTVRISYQPALIPQNPTLGPFREAMVVRSTAGFPATNLDGVMIMRHLSVDPVLNHGFASVLDKELNPQQWYYYSLFARYDNTSGWFKVGEQAWLNPGEYGNAERFWQGFPDYYRRIDSGGWVYPGVLRRLCDVFGYEFDAHRSWAATVGDVWDFEKLSAKLLPEAGAALGLIQESANGDRRLRTLTGNLMSLRKQKGTKDGVEGYVGALTGYPTRAYEGLNLLHRIQHTEWPNGFFPGTQAGSPTVDNHPGWSSFHAITYGQVIRQVAAGGEGTPVGMADGSFYLRNNNNTGAASFMTLVYGPDGNSWHTYVPVIAGHQYRMSTAMKCSSSISVTAAFEWLDGTGTQLGAQVTTTLGTVGTTWVRVICAAVTAPATAKFVRLFIYTSSMANNSHINIYKPMFVDLAWRPEGIPSLAGTAPLSSVLSADIGTYIHQDFYEPPREVKVNVYPNRTNFALNSDFTLNDTPAGAWSTFDAPTYGQLPIAYTDYADIIDAAPDWETSYADMATGLYPLTGVPPTLLWDTATGRLHINKTTSPYAWTLMHTYFPVATLGGMSAAIGAYSDAVPTTDPAYLSPATGYASTPDPGPLPIQFTLVAKFRGPTSTSQLTIAAQQPGSPNQSWAWTRNSTDTTIQSYSTDGTAVVNRSMNVPAATGGDEMYAMTFNRNDGAGHSVVTIYRSTDNGASWVLVYSSTGSTVGLLFDTTAALTIGAKAAGVSVWDGRIYSVEMRTGLDPNGTLSNTTTVGSILLPANPGNNMYTPDVSGALSGTGDFCIVARIAPTSWTPSSPMTIASKYLNVGSARSWIFQLNTAGTLGFTWSSNGTADAGTVNSTAAVPGVVAGSAKWVGVAFDINDGIGNRIHKFWTSDDGVTWTQLGTTSTVAGVTTINVTTLANMYLGSHNNGGNQLLDARYYYLSLRNGFGTSVGIGGTEIYRFDGATDLFPGMASAASPIYTYSGHQIVINTSAGAPQTTIQPMSRGLVWRFDAAESGGATSYVDPRGRTWTVSSGSALTMPTGGTKLSLAFEWYDAIGSSIKVNNVPVRHTSPPYALGLTERRYELVNAQPPANARYGRLLVMVSNIGPHDTSLTWALIEDSPYPESYFNGDSNDGDDGDFFYSIGKGYTGAAHQSPSVYYQRFRRFASGVSGSDALTTLMPLLLPFRRSFKVLTAATGLYNVPT